MERTVARGCCPQALVANSSAFEVFWPLLEHLAMQVQCSLYYFFVISLGLGVKKGVLGGTQVDMIVVKRIQEQERQGQRVMLAV